MESGRIRRMLQLLFLVQSEAGWTPTRLARHFRTSKRGIYRDIADLKAAGVVLEWDRSAGAYRLARGALLPPVQLTPDEVLALHVLCEHLAGRGQIAYLAPAWRAVVKLTSALPESLRGEVAPLASAMAIRTARAMPAEDARDVYTRVQQALAAGKALRCRYEPREGGDGGEFLFEPYTLFFAVRAWYAVGLHRGRGALRCLKLSRFTKAALADEPARVPPGFSLDDYLGNAWQLIRGERDYEVELRFDPAFAPTVSETLWHRTQETEEQADGSVVMRCTVSGLEEIVWWVLSMGPHCRVLRPPELAERVRDLAAATAGLYGPTQMEGPRVGGAGGGRIHSPL